MFVSVYRARAEPRIACHYIRYTSISPFVDPAAFARGTHPCATPTGPVVAHATARRGCSTGWPRCGPSPARHRPRPLSGAVSAAPLGRSTDARDTCQPGLGLHASNGWHIWLGITTCPSQSHGAHATAGYQPSTSALGSLMAAERFRSHTHTPSCTLNPRDRHAAAREEPVRGVSHRHPSHSQAQPSPVGMRWVHRSGLQKPAARNATEYRGLYAISQLPAQVLHQRWSHTQPPSRPVPG